MQDTNKKIKFVLYTRPNCHFCDLTKAWLENTGAKEKIEYIEYNIFEKSEAGQLALKKLQDLKIMGVPYIEITDLHGEMHVINGYDEETMQKVIFG